MKISDSSIGLHLLDIKKENIIIDDCVNDLCHADTAIVVYVSHKPNPVKFVIKCCVRVNDFFNIIISDFIKNVFIGTPISMSGYSEDSIAKLKKYIKARYPNFDDKKYKIDSYFVIALLDDDGFMTD